MKIAAIILVLALTGCSRESKQTVSASTAPVATVVAVAPVTRETLVRREVLAADFHPYQIVEVHSKVAGYIKKIYVDVGDHVKEGQTLAVLEVPELADEMTRARAAKSRSNAEVDRAQEEINRAQAQHEATHLVYERLQKIVKTRPNLIAQQEIDDARARDQSAEASISVAKATLAASRQGVDVSQADVEKTQTMNGYSKITAPFAGIVTKRYADTGAMIPAGTASTSNGLPVVQISQNNLLRLTLPIPEAIVARIRLGQSVDIKVGALNRTFQGKVTRFASTVSRATRTMDTQIDVPNPGLILIPGMYAEAVITLDKHENVLSVPLEAATAGTAYVVNAESKIEIRPIKLGLEGASKVEVLSGLKEGDRVVTGNRSQLTAGQTVTAKVVVPAKAVKAE